MSKLGQKCFAITKKDSECGKEIKKQLFSKTYGQRFRTSSVQHGGKEAMMINASLFPSSDKNYPSNYQIPSACPRQPVSGLAPDISGNLPL